MNRASDAAVLREVYAQLTTYLGALRDARGAAKGGEVRELLDSLTDAGLDAERRVLEASRKAAGQTQPEGY